MKDYYTSINCDKEINDKKDIEKIFEYSMNYYEYIRNTDYSIAELIDYAEKKNKHFLTELIIEMIDKIEKLESKKINEKIYI